MNLANAVKRLLSAEKDVLFFQREVDACNAEILRLQKEQQTLPNNAGEGEV